MSLKSKQHPARSVWKRRLGSIDNEKGLLTLHSARLLALFFAAASTLQAQTSAPSSATPPTAAHHRAVHRRVSAKATACPEGQAAPVTPPGLPAVTGPVQTAFALRYIDIAPGAGAPVQPGDFLTVHYTGWLAATGVKFDSSVDRGVPFQFQQGTHHVIPGWDEGFGGMRVGGKRRLFIPWQLAYGAQGQPPVIPPQSDLIFDIEVVAASSVPPDESPFGGIPRPSTPPQPAGTPQR